ncbi:MAG: trimethylamine methyltransferase family protein [Chloroflexi bacterium]|nr:trimethylamine methyltransferase family protein [Chloroflexota bacterium]
MLINRFPRVEVLDDQQVEILLDRTYRVLEEIGCVFTLDLAMDLLEALPGTQVDRDRQLVKIDRATVQQAVRQCPNPFILHARNPAKTVPVGGDSVTFTTTIGSPFVQDFKRGRRPGSLADFVELVKIAHMLPEIDVVDSGLCEPQDIEVDARTLWRSYAAFKHCDRPLAGSTWHLGVEDSMAVADLVFGEQLDRPVYCTIMNGMSPLAWDDRMCEAIIGYARRNQALIFMCGPLGGFTGPMTFAGTLIQGYAEQLAGITLAQAARSGAPVLFGAGAGPAEMKVGQIISGGSEMALSQMIGAQIARRLNLPCRTSGTTTMSKIPDLQAGLERMLGILSAVFGGANHIVHSAATLDSILCANYELMVADADIIGIVQRTFRGIDINPETLAFDVIKEVGPFGEFITHEHTFKHFRGAYWEGRVVDRNFYAEWVRRGAKTAEERAYDVWNDLLAKHEVAPLDPAAEREIERLIAAREREIATAAATAV